MVTHREHEISNIRFDTYPSALLILPAGGESLFRPRNFKCAFGRSDPESYIVGTARENYFDSPRELFSLSGSFDNKIAIYNRNFLKAQSSTRHDDDDG